MVDPGLLSAAIGVSMQMLVNKMIEWIKRAVYCQKELDKLKDDLLSLILSFYKEMQKCVDRIDSVPSSVDSWLTKLKEHLQRGSHFVEECTVPSRCFIHRIRLSREISRFSSALREHLATSSPIALLQQLHLHAAVLEKLELLRIPASEDLLPSTSSPILENDASGDDISVQLCFLRLATFPEDQDINTAVATKYWIGEGLVAGPDHLQTGQRYVNLLADFCLIEPLSKDGNGNVRLFRTPDDFHDLANQIVQEEESFLRTVGDASDDERSNADVEIRIVRGTNLAVRDRWRSRSDPYVVVRLGNQKRETGVIRKSLNPVWNAEISLPVLEPQTPLLKLEVFDKDRLSKDDPMGYGEVDLKNLARAARILRTSQLPSLATMNTEGLCIECVDGQMVQKVCCV